MKIENKTLMETFIDRCRLSTRGDVPPLLRLVYFLDAKNSTDCRQMVQGARPQ